MTADLRTGPALAGLLTIPGIGEKRATKLADHYRTWEALLAATSNDLAAILGTATSHKYLAHRPHAPVVADLPDGTQVVSRFENDYPARLRTIPNPPLLLWYRGTLPPEDLAAVAVVGTRRPNRWGTAVAETISTQVAENGYAHISGLALGVDSLGHAAALHAGGNTWAVLGQGIDTLGGGERGRLAQQIVESGGGLLSEVPPGTPVAAHLLTKRNRIQAGLSDAVVIAQTGLATPDKPAGTLHTVRYTIEQHRHLMVPRPPATWATADTAGNLALTDPNGCDPALLHITDEQLAAHVAARRPVADRVIGDRHDSATALAHLDRFHTAAQDADNEGDQTRPLW